MLVLLNNSGVSHDPKENFKGEIYIVYVNNVYVIIASFKSFKYILWRRQSWTCHRQHAASSGLIQRRCGDTVLTC